MRVSPPHFRDLPTAAADRLEAIVGRFEQAWRQGDTPVLEDYLQAESAERLALLIELVHTDLECRFRLGEPAGVETYFRRYRELAEHSRVAVDLIARERELRQRSEPGLGLTEFLARFPAHHAELAARQAPPADDPFPTVASLVAVLRQGPLVQPEQVEQLDGLQAGCRRRDLARELVLRQWLTPFQIDRLFRGRAEELTLGPYLLLERLGEGGMGQVFKARHQLMRRVVALKVIRKDRLSHPEMVARFQREVQMAARLSHPNIVLVHDAASAGDTPFLVMEYVEGTDLARLLAMCGPLPVAGACAYVRQAALGLQHAHERGLVHRDLKPANLLVTPQGQVKVLDLGLARLRQAVDNPTLTGGLESALTVEGAVVGTPDYIAPEQAQEAHSVDIRADIYSLGCTLYALLAGQPPFPGGTALQKLLRHQQAEPAPIGSLRPDVPPALGRVLARMMAKRPEERYRVPAEAAQALEVFCDVRPPLPLLSTDESLAGTHRGDPARSWPRRAWPLAAAGAALLLALAVGLGKSPAPPKASVAEEQPSPTNPPVANKLLSALARLDPADIPPYNRPEGTFEGAKVVTVLGEHRRHWDGNRTLFVLSPTGKRVATVPGESSWIQITDAETLRPLYDLRGHKGRITALAISPDGQFLASSGVDDGTLRVWDLDRRKEICCLARGKERDQALALSEGGRRLLSSEGPVVRVWDVPAARELGRFEGHPGLVVAVILSPDGKQAVSASGLGRTAPKGGAILLWDVESRKAVRRFEEVPTEMWELVLAWSPDGRWVLAGTRDPSFLYLWDAATGRQKWKVNCDSRRSVSGLSFSRDQRHFLATTGYQALLYDLATGKRLREFLTYRAAFLPDGKWALTFGKSAGFWNTETGEVKRPLIGHTSPVGSVAFSHDGRYLLSSGQDRLRLWDLETRKDLERFPPSLEGEGRAILSPNGQRALSWGPGLKLWNVRKGLAERTLMKTGQEVLAPSSSGAMTRR